MANIFDMALYPTYLVSALGQIWHPAVQASIAYPIKVAIVLLSLSWNLFGARAVGKGSLVLGSIVLSPFVVIVFLALFRNEPLGQHVTAAAQARPDRKSVV
jgi:amino acid transporter